MDVQPDLISQMNKLRKDIFWTRCVLGLALLCVAALTAANWRRHPQTVEANEFLLRGHSGNVAARLGQSGFGDTCLTLMAKGEVAVASMCVQDAEGSSLDLHNLKSESRATLTPGFNAYESLTSRFQPQLLINAGNTSFANLNVGAETHFVIAHNSKDSVRISSSVGEAKITLFGANGSPVWSTH